MNETLTLALVWLAAGGALGYVVGVVRGEQRGRDLQRIDDITDLWRAMPDRDARGRFKHKEHNA
jgi:hypothetical protein